MNKSKNPNYRIKENQVLLCCGKANCPSVEISEEKYIVIKDDFGGMVKIPKERANMIQGAIDILNARK